MEYLEVDRGRIAYDFQPSAELNSAGTADQLLLLINGFQRTHSDFRALRKKLHHKFPTLATVAWDNRGCGDSQNQMAEFSIKTMCDDALKIAEHCCETAGVCNYAVLGISMGGMIAQQCSAHNNKVTKLILISTSLQGSVIPSHQQSFQPWPLDEASMMTRMKRYFGSKFRHQSPLLIKAMVQNMLKSSKILNQPHRSLAQFLAVQSFDGRSIAQFIQCPTLILCGQEDEIISVNSSILLQKMLLHAKLIIYPEVGHLLLAEEPEKLVADVGDFLSC